MKCFSWADQPVSPPAFNRTVVLFTVKQVFVHWALTIIGVAAESNQLHLGFQANTIRHRRVLSLFQPGKLIIAAADPPKLNQLDLKTALGLIKAHEMI